MAEKKRVNPLKKARGKAKMTSSDLAIKAGVNRGTIHRLETKDARARISTLQKLADALEIPVDDLAELEFKEVKKPNN